MTEADFVRLLSTANLHLSGPHAGDEAAAISRKEKRGRS
jgi:hypothetical protein